MWVWVAREDFEVTVVHEAAPTIMLAVGDTERERIVPKAKKFLLIREAGEATLVLSRRVAG